MRQNKIARISLVIGEHTDDRECYNENDKYDWAQNVGAAVFGQRGVEAMRAHLTHVRGPGVGSLFHGNLNGFATHLLILHSTIYISVFFCFFCFIWY